jgi:hypothetical protein
VLTVAELRQHVVTDLPDEALQRIIDANDALIRRYAGEHPPITLTETYEVWPPATRLVVERPIDSVSTIVNDGVTMSPTDYRAVGRIIYAKNWGVFRNTVEVTYTPRNDIVQRRLILVQMCLLDVSDQGVAAASSGQVRIERLDITQEKRKLLHQLGYVQVV